MQKPVLLLACGWLFVAGCASTPPRPTSNQPLPPDWDTEFGPAHEIEPAVALPVRTNLPLVTAPVIVATPGSGMVALSLWARQNGLREPRMVQMTPVASHAVTTANGTFVVQAGRLAAYWDGLQVRLGFPPQQVGNQIFLHALDLKKVLEPLARGLAVSTPANRLVVIDPGHGGANSGTRSVVDGHYEKEFTLDWARRIVPLLEAKGWRVVLTRTSDVELSLPDRIAVADAQRADLFLSLHFNSAGDNREPTGLESYCLTPANMPSSLTRGEEDDPRSIFPNNAFDAENLKYAVRLHRHLLLASGRTDRGVRHARFLGVLRNQNRPAVLVEGGYLSNPREARQIGDPAYRQRLAEAVAKALP